MVGYGRPVATTKLLASGSEFAVDPEQSELAQLELSPYRAVRLSVGNWVGSTSPVEIAASHVASAGSPNANLITGLDSFTLAPGDSATKVYEVPGNVVVFLASPQSTPTAGVQIDVTICGRTD